MVTQKRSVCPLHPSESRMNATGLEDPPTGVSSPCLPRPSSASSGVECGWQSCSELLQTYPGRVTWLSICLLAFLVGLPEKSTSRVPAPICDWLLVLWVTVVSTEPYLWPPQGGVLFQSMDRFHRVHIFFISACTYSARNTRARVRNHKGVPRTHARVMTNFTWILVIIIINTGWGPSVFRDSTDLCLPYPQRDLFNQCYFQYLNKTEAPLIQAIALSTGKKNSGFEESVQRGAQDFSCDKSI